MLVVPKDEVIIKNEQKEDFGFFDEMPQITPESVMKTNDIEEKIAIPVEETNQEEETLVVRKQRNTLSNNDNNDDASKK